MQIHANESVQDLLTPLKSREEDQTHQCQTKSHNRYTSYLIDVVWDGIYVTLRQEMEL